MHWIKEENYDDEMRQVAEPYVSARRQSGFDIRVKGQPIYYEHYCADHPRAVVVICHGFTESVQKYTESVYYMLQAGYDVWGLDHRGHGFSYRENNNPYVVHVNRFQDYVKDLKHLVTKKVRPASGKLPVYLYAHSMGGCIGAWTIERYPKLFNKAVLSSPMLGLSFGKAPVFLVYAGALLKSLGGKKSEPLKPVKEFEKENFEQSCDSSACRYHYYYRKRANEIKLQTCSPSMGWGMEAVKACARVTSQHWTGKIKIPVLLLQAGNDTVVKNASQDRFTEQIEACNMIQVPEQKHELYMTDTDVLIPYWENIFTFFDDAPSGSPEA